MIWKPDVCGCVIEFDGNWDNPGELSVSKCIAHEGLSDKDAMMTAWEDCRLKERVRALAEDMEAPWEFDEDRKFILHLPRVSAQHKKAMKDKLPSSDAARVELD